LLLNARTRADTDLEKPSLPSGLAVYGKKKRRLDSPSHESEKYKERGVRVQKTNATKAS